MTDRIDRISKLYRHNYGDSDISRFKRNHRSFRLWVFGLVLATVVLALLAFLVGFLVFGPFPGDSTDQTQGVIVKIEGLSSISAGQEVGYLISISNSQKVSLTRTETRIIYPEGFFLEEFIPQPAEELVSGGLWRLGDFKPEEVRKIRLRGKLFGELGQSKQVKVFFSFEPTNFASTFQKQASFVINVDQPCLSLTFEGPEELIQGQSGDFIWQAKASCSLKNVRLIFEYPETFVFRDGLESLAGEKSWQIEEIKEGEKKEGIFNGYLLGQLGNWQFKLKTGLLDEQDVFWLQEEKDIFLALKEAPLSLRLSLDKDDLTLSYKLVYQNTSQDEIKDLLFKLKVKDSRLIDWDQTGQWQQEISRVVPGKEEEILFTLNTISEEEMTGLGIESPELLSSIEASGKFLSSGGEIDFQKYSNEVVLKFD